MLISTTLTSWKDNTRQINDGHVQEMFHNIVADRFYKAVHLLFETIYTYFRLRASLTLRQQAVKESLDQKQVD